MKRIVTCKEWDEICSNGFPQEKKWGQVLFSVKVHGVASSREITPLAAAQDSILGGWRSIPVGGADLRIAHASGVMPGAVL
jgi:hypothetical protein